MAIYSPLRSRRLAAQQQADETRRLITFKLREETFALPLDRVHKVTTIDRLYGDPNHTGVSLTTYQGRELVVIDVGVRIFGRAPQVVPQTASNISAVSASESELVKYLLLIQLDLVGKASLEENRLIGLPIDSPPSIQSIQVSAFQPLPEIYRLHSQIHCVSSLSIDTPNRPSIFLLDIAAITSSW